jgi:ApbE superfamily uncharacterized protein (UPF0280 family)
MSASRVDVTIEISTADPSAVLHCRRCGASKTLVGPAAAVAGDVADFTNTHLDCPLVEAADPRTPLSLDT